MFPKERPGEREKLSIAGGIWGLSGGLGPDTSGPSQLCLTFQTYPESSGELLKGFTMGVIRSDIVYRNLLWIQCGREIGVGQAWQWEYH